MGTNDGRGRMSCDDSSDVHILLEKDFRKEKVEYKLVIGKVQLLRKSRTALFCK